MFSKDPNQEQTMTELTAEVLADGVRQLVANNRPFAEHYAFIFEDYEYHGRPWAFRIFWDCGRVAAELMISDRQNDSPSFLTVGDTFYDTFHEKFVTTTGIEDIRSVYPKRDEAKRAATETLMAPQVIIENPRRA